MTSTDDDTDADGVEVLLENPEKPDMASSPAAPATPNKTKPFEFVEAIALALVPSLK